MSRSLAPLYAVNIVTSVSACFCFFALILTPPGASIREIASVGSAIFGVSSFVMSFVGWAIDR